MGRFSRLMNEKKALILIMAIVVLITAGCTNAQPSVISDTVKGEENIITPTPASTVESVEAPSSPKIIQTPEPTLVPETTITLNPTMIPVSIEKEFDMSEDEFWDYFMIPLDTEQYYDGDFIYHIDNSYNYSIEYPKEWLEKIEYRRRADSFYAIQELVVDFDGYKSYDNEIILKSTMFPADFILFDELANEYLQTYDGHIIGIYYTNNTSDRMEFNFNISGYKNLQGSVKMPKGQYNANKTKIFNMLKSINIKEIYSEDEYYKGKIDDLNIKFMIPYYWKEHAIPHQNEDSGVVSSASILMTMGYPTESAPNFFSVTMGYDENINISEYDDLIAYTNDGNIIRFKNNSQSEYYAVYDFVIEDLQIEGSFDLEQDIYESHREEIVAFLRSFSKASELDLERVEKKIPESNIRTTYISESNRLSLTYPSMWQEYVYASGSECFEVWFGADEYFFSNYIRIRTFTDENLVTKLPEEDLAKLEKLITDSGLVLYLDKDESEFKGLELVTININFNNSQVFFGQLSLEKELYYQYEEEIIELLKSIDVVDE